MRPVPAAECEEQSGERDRAPRADAEPDLARDRPRMLLLTDMVPKATSGYGIRVSNVVEGLTAVGDLHVCLVDSSTDGERLPPGRGYATSTVRATDRPRWLKLVTSLGRLPTHVGYRGARALKAAVRGAVGGQEWDVVWCSRARVHLLTTGVVSGRRVVDLDDLNDRLLSTEIQDRKARHGALRTAPRNAWDAVDVVRWRRLQRRIAGEVEHVAVCSRVDQAHLAAPNTELVPNGYPTPRRSVDPVPGDDAVGPRSGPTVLFVGPLTYEPNRLAVEWLVCEVLPLMRQGVPRVRVVVVGDSDGVAIAADPPPGVTFVGRVPDVAPFYREADVAVAPLHSGGGTRLKVIEALARRVPLVSTTFGAEGLDLVPGRELLVADDAAAFAAACVSVIEDERLRACLVAAGAARYERDLTADASALAVARLAARTAAVGGAGADAQTSSAAVNAGVVPPSRSR